MDQLKEELVATRARIRERMAQKRAAIEKVKAETEAIWKQVEALEAEAEALRARIQTLVAGASAIEQPRLHDLKQELGQAARTDAALTQQIKAM